MSTIPKWNEEREATLNKIVGKASPVVVATVEKAAVELETTTKSIAAKLRKMGREVESMAKVVTKNYSEADEAEIKKFLEANPNVYTYKERNCRSCT